jgi:hypothetical protein
LYIESASVPYAVKRVIGSSSFLLQALRSGIVNYTALAQRIKPDIEKLTKASVNLNTLVVAIKRFADSLQGVDTSHATVEGIRMSLTGSIIVVGFSTVSREMARVLETLLESDKEYSMFRTNGQISFFAESREIHTLYDVVHHFQGVIKEGFSKITINLPSDIDSAYSILSTISYILSTSQIPIYNAFFSNSQIVLILNVQDAAKAYEIIRGEISGT